MVRKKKFDDDVVPPQNIEAEKSLLGSMLISENAVSVAIEFLSEDSFYMKKHGMIFKGIISLYDKNEPVDVITLSEKMRSMGALEEIGGASYLTELAGTVPTAANIGQYANIVRDKQVLRRLIEVSGDIMNKCHDTSVSVNEILDDAEKEIFKISQSKVDRSFYDMKSLMKDSLETVDRLYTKKSLVTGISTGFMELDKMTSGFQNSDMIVLAARPSMGKTALALNIAENAAIKYNFPVAVFSLEMSKENLALRMLCSLARVNANKVRTGFLSKQDFPNLANAAGRLSAAPIYIDDTPSLSVLALRAKARRMMSQKKIKFIVVDYLQLMTSYGGRFESRQQEISEYSRSLKALARELDIPVMVISQLNRAVESRQDHRPQLADLRESGAIEQDADLVMLLMRPDYYEKDEKPGIAEVNIAKQRNGPVGKFDLKFFIEFTRFDNLAEKDELDEHFEEEDF
ncbi:MAG: replicative DNA helicase [Candidatus Aureabacteria bacterium]|nr:replicative DNA helicase [Candidatus Auribacterota bacterium]